MLFVSGRALFVLSFGAALAARVMKGPVQIMINLLIIPTSACLQGFTTFAFCNLSPEGVGGDLKQAKKKDKRCLLRLSAAERPAAAAASRALRCTAAGV